jgi:hypothetical protein
VLNVGAGVFTAFGLLATTGVLNALLAAGPTPDRVRESMPALALVAASYAVRGALQSGAGWAQSRLRPQIRRAVEIQLLELTSGVRLSALDDTAFLDDLKRAETRGVMAAPSMVTSAPRRGDRAGRRERLRQVDAGQPARRACTARSTGSISWDGVDLASSTRTRCGSGSRWSCRSRPGGRSPPAPTSPSAGTTGPRRGRPGARGGPGRRRARLRDGAARQYDTLLSRHFTDGADLSGGQWQRLAVSRAFYRDAPLLICDEPTANLDARAEHDVYQRLRELAAGRTVVLITHRMASVREADRIYVLDHGAVVEEGDHAALMALGGLYSELYTLQANAYQSRLSPSSSRSSRARSGRDWFWWIRSSPSPAMFATRTRARPNGKPHMAATSATDRQALAGLEDRPVLGRIDADLPRRTLLGQDERLDRQVPRLDRRVRAWVRSGRWPSRGAAPGKARSPGPPYVRFSTHLYGLLPGDTEVKVFLPHVVGGRHRVTG